MKTKQRQQAIKFRKSGFSIKEIAKKIHISQSTASLWLNGIILGDKAKKRLQNRSIYGSIRAVNTNKKKREVIIVGIKRQAQKVVSGINFSKDLARLSSALLYWCEGEKNSSTVCFMNSDPVLVKTFLGLLRHGFKLDEDKFRVCLHLHSYHNESKQIDFWSAVTGIQKKNFLKVFKKENSGIATKRDYPGCASVRYHDHKVAKQLQFIWEFFANKYRGVV
ncbi:MAG: helix-turn-helix domain-containing protein [bacterium]|nr:helix-turn-helix domain-containing protein [bacterium]